MRAGQEQVPQDHTAHITAGSYRIAKSLRI